MGTLMGMIRVKIKLSPYIEALVSEVSQLSEKSKTAIVEQLLEQIESHARHGELPKTFGLNIIEAAALINARGLGAKHLDPVHQAGGERIDFDASLLERSAKTKTGFAGVSATGTSFRALVPDVEMGGGTRYLPSRPTALAAAIDRFHWFEKYGIPYGNVGFHIEEARKLHPEKSIEQHLVELRDFLSGGAVYGLKNPVTLEEVERVLARHRTSSESSMPVRERRVEALPTIFDENENALEDLKHEITKQAATPESRLKAVPDVVICAVCKEEIDGTEPFSPHGKADYAHQSCLA